MQKGVDEVVGGLRVFVVRKSIHKLFRFTDTCICYRRCRQVLKDSGKGKALKIVNSGGWKDTVLWSPYGDEGMGFDVCCPPPPPPPPAPCPLPPAPCPSPNPCPVPRAPCPHPPLPLNKTMISALY